MRLKIFNDGTRFWLERKHIPHRIGGPAIEDHNGDETWLLHNRYFRFDNHNPVKSNRGEEIYYIKGCFFNKREFNEKVSHK